LSPNLFKVEKHPYNFLIFKTRTGDIDIFAKITIKVESIK